MTTPAHAQEYRGKTGAHAQRGAVCLSVTQHLTSSMFVRLTNGTTYLTGNEGQKMCTVFSENAPLQS